MSPDAELAHLLARTGVGLPRGVLGPEAHRFAQALAGGADEERLAALRAAAATAHWEELRLAIGAGLERAQADADDAAGARAIALTEDPDPGNPLALALADEAGRSLAAVLARTDERLGVLERRLGGGGGDGELALVVGAIVADLLDLDPDDYEDEIAAYVGAGETDAARRELARATGDEDSRHWAREALRGVTGADAPSATGAVRMLAAGDPPEDPAEDAVWLAAMLALVEQAVEYAQLGGDRAGADAPEDE